MRFNFIKPTLIFAIVGIFIPGFTAIGLLGIQLFLSKMGVECSKAWIIIWSISTIAVFILPLWFYRYISLLKNNKIKSIKTKLTIFNTTEYVLIQATLTPLFTNGQVLCYGNDAQNGLELIFSAWSALPVLIILSFIFNYLNKYNGFFNYKGK